MFKDFKKFVLRGNVMDMAVGVIIGAAFGAIVASLVADLISPLIGFLVGDTDFSNLFIVLRTGTPIGPYTALADAQAAGAVTLNYGSFLTAVVSFLLVAFVIFMLVRGVNKLREKKDKDEVPAEPTTKECPQCLSTIPIKAIRCAHCTSELTA